MLLTLSQVANANNVWREVNEWKQGDPIPTDLKTSRVCHGDDCGMKPDLGLHSIAKTQNTQLLWELVLGRDSISMVFSVALGRLLEEDGLPKVRSLLINKPVLRKEHRDLRELFGHRIALMHVAEINNSVMPREDAEKVLRRLGELLEAGAEWNAAYQLVADENPDEREGRQGSTLVSYKYSGWLTAHRFDVQFREEQGMILMSHLGQVFEHGGGNLVLEGYDGLYLYRVEKIYEPEI